LFLFDPANEEMVQSAARLKEMMSAIFAEGSKLPAMSCKGPGSTGK